MKNLFDFATKELSQDAFLRWLFESYDSSDAEVKEASRSLLIAFINNPKYTVTSIVRLWTKAQDHKADIVVWLEMNDGYKYGIIIEDKTYSSEHNQLLKYQCIFEQDKYWNENTNERKYIFYKTGFIQDWERNTVKNAKWELFDLKRIRDFWQRYSNGSNLLLNWYANHINKLYELYSNTELVTEPNSKFNAIAWFGFFNNVLKERYKNDFKIYVENSNYGYSYITFRPLIPIAKEDNTPYLEITSRDCNVYADGKIIGTNLIAKWLVYGMEWRFKEKSIGSYVDKLRDTIDDIQDSLFISDRKFDKVIAHTKKEEINSKEEFLLKLDKILKDYKKIYEAANIESLELEYKYSKLYEDKIEIIKNISNKLKEVKSEDFKYKEIGCYNLYGVYKSYFSSYINIEDNGLTLEAYIMKEPTDREYEGFPYEEADILYIALWNRGNRDYDFSKFITPDCKKIITEGRNAWGKHYIIKRYDLKAHTSEFIIKTAVQFITEEVKKYTQSKNITL